MVATAGFGSGSKNDRRIWPLVRSGCFILLGLAVIVLRLVQLSYQSTGVSGLQFMRPGIRATVLWQKRRRERERKRKEFRRVRGVAACIPASGL